MWGDRKNWVHLASKYCIYKGSCTVYWLQDSYLQSNRSFMADLPKGYSGFLCLISITSFNESEESKFNFYIAILLLHVTVDISAYVYSPSKAWRLRTICFLYWFYSFHYQNIACVSLLYQALVSKSKPSPCSFFIAFWFSVIYDCIQRYCMLQIHPMWWRHDKVYRNIKRLNLTALSLNI